MPHVVCEDCSQSFGSDKSFKIHEDHCTGADKSHYHGLKRCSPCRLWLIKSSSHNCKGEPAPTTATFDVVEEKQLPKPDKARLFFRTAAINLDGTNFTTPGVTTQWVGSVLLPAFVDQMRPAFVFVSEANGAAHFNKKGYGKYEGKFTGGDRYAFIWNTEWKVLDSHIREGERDVTFVAVHKETKYRVVVTGCHLRKKSNGTQGEQWKADDLAAFVRSCRELEEDDLYKSADQFVVLGDMNASPSELEQAGADVLYKHKRFTQGTTVKGNLIDNCFHSDEAYQWYTMRTQLSHFVIVQGWATKPEPATEAECVKSEHDRLLREKSEIESQIAKLNEQLTKKDQELSDFTRKHKMDTTAASEATNKTAAKAEGAKAAKAGVLP
jgi:hypothetical protein